jgi:hypothetical protein
MRIIENWKNVTFINILLAKILTENARIAKT